MKKLILFNLIVFGISTNTFASTSIGVLKNKLATNGKEFIVKLSEKTIEDNPSDCTSSDQINDCNPGLLKFEGQSLDLINRRFQRLLSYGYNVASFAQCEKSEKIETCVLTQKYTHPDSGDNDKNILRVQFVINNGIYENNVLVDISE